jgi:hypothetical protein
LLSFLDSLKRSKTEEPPKEKNERLDEDQDKHEQEQINRMFHQLAHQANPVNLQGNLLFEQSQKSQNSQQGLQGLHQGQQGLQQGQKVHQQEHISQPSHQQRIHGKQDTIEAGFKSQCGPSSVGQGEPGRGDVVGKPSTSKCSCEQVRQCFYDT